MGSPVPRRRYAGGVTVALIVVLVLTVGALLAYKDDGPKRGSNHDDPMSFYD